jgi:hypothetical protein
MPSTRSQRSTCTTAALGNIDIITNILGYAVVETKDVPNVALVSRHWNDVVNVNPNSSQGIWYNICVVQNPEILRIYDLCAESTTCKNIGGGGYKVLLHREATSSFKPEGLN